MNFLDLIIKKRDKLKLNKSEIEYFIKGVTHKTIPDYQISAMLMAICLNKMDIEETAMLTDAMTNSGKTLDLSTIDGIKVDKHSTGGVGDTTTLVLAPLTASLGLPVIKMSGRGLGHTGGTLDKLESIPQFNTSLTEEQAFSQVQNHSIALMGQTADLAPADKYLYALRDVTGTVENISLIASSIMSKKLAAGSDAIVLDVKYGNGAFMKTPQDAEELANTMIGIGKHLGKKMTAFITNMNEPLGMNIGNSLEVIEAIEILKGNTEGALKKVSLALGSEMLVLGGIFQDANEAEKALEENIKNGKGLEKFRELINLQGGNSNVIEDYSLFPQPKEKMEVKAINTGYVNYISTESIGRASVATGAGRITKSDKLDYSAGIIMKKRIGDFVNTDDTIAYIYSSDKEKCQNAANIIRQAVTIGEKPQEQPLIYSKIMG